MREDSWSSGERARTETKEQTTARPRAYAPDMCTLISGLLNE